MIDDLIWGRSFQGYTQHYIWFLCQKVHHNLRSEKSAHTEPITLMYTVVQEWLSSINTSGVIIRGGLFVAYLLIIEAKFYIDTIGQLSLLFTVLAKGDLCGQFSSINKTVGFQFSVVETNPITGTGRYCSPWLKVWGPSQSWQEPKFRNRFWRFHVDSSLPVRMAKVKEKLIYMRESMQLLTATY